MVFILSDVSSLCYFKEMESLYFKNCPVLSCFYERNVWDIAHSFMEELKLIDIINSIFWEVFRGDLNKEWIVGISRTVRNVVSVKLRKPHVVMWDQACQTKLHSCASYYVLFAWLISPYIRYVYRPSWSECGIPARFYAVLSVCSITAFPHVRTVCLTADINCSEYSECDEAKEA